MGKKKSRQTTTATYAYTTPPDTPDIIRARDLSQNVDFSTPVNNAFGQAENDIQNQFFEDELPDDVKERIKLGEMFNMRMQKGAALSDAKGREHAFKTGAAMNVAGLTAPQQVQTGGTSYGQQWGGQLQNFGFSLGNTLGQA